MVAYFLLFQARWVVINEHQMRLQIYQECQQTIVICIRAPKTHFNKASHSTAAFRHNKNLLVVNGSLQTITICAR